MTYQAIIIRLYFLLIYADGDANHKELLSAKQMIATEGILEPDLIAQLALLKAKAEDVIYKEAIDGLKRLERSKQLRIVAWLCVLANADGFMERSEWQLIYKIYHKELALPLNEIFEVQKGLNKLVWENASINSSSPL
jgi:uncharacterized tellurite resistance protein B-like protein